MIAIPEMPKIGDWPVTRDVLEMFDRADTLEGLAYTNLYELIPPNGDSAAARSIKILR